MCLRDFFSTLQKLQCGLKDFHTCLIVFIFIFRDHLSRVFDLVFDVDLLDSRDPTNLQLLGRPDLNVTFTKFHCWKLTMFDKAVFLDADTLVCQLDI